MPRTILMRRFGCIRASHGFHRMQVRSPWPRIRVLQRIIVTQSIEPPLDSSVQERPCTLVLVENMGCYSESWLPVFSQTLPKERGIHFCHSSLENRATSLATALDELERDLATIPNTILVTRGPLWSWVAQFYLESFPLAGLVMVDPVINVEADSDPMAHYNLLCQSSGTDPKANETEYNLMERISTHKETRKLKLEPGSVPMLMFHSVREPGFVQAVYSTARRHGGTAEGFEDLVSVADLTNHDAEDAAALICDWVDNHVI